MKSLTNDRIVHWESTQQPDNTYTPILNLLKRRRGVVLDEGESSSAAEMLVLGLLPDPSSRISESLAAYWNISDWRRYHRENFTLTGTSVTEGDTTEKTLLLLEHQWLKEIPQRKLYSYWNISDWRRYHRENFTLTGTSATEWDTTEKTLLLLEHQRLKDRPQRKLYSYWNISDWMRYHRENFTLAASAAINS